MQDGVQGVAPADIPKSTVSFESGLALAGAEPEPLIQPVHTAPRAVLPGLPGVIEHIVLNDRRRILTRDSASTVVMWDTLTVPRTPTAPFRARPIALTCPADRSAGRTSGHCRGAAGRAGLGRAGQTAPAGAGLDAQLVRRRH